MVLVLSFQGFRLPISDPVLVFALAMSVFVLAPLLFERFRVSGLIGLILAGTLVGPNGLGLLERDESMVLLGTVGLLYLMFMAGVEIDLHGFGRYRNRSLIFGAVTFAIPMALGVAMGRVLGYAWGPAVLLGSMLASHTLLAYPLAGRLGIAKNEAVTATVGATIITDLASLLVLAVVAASVQGELNAAFWLRLTVSLAVFAALVLLGLPRLARWFFRNEDDGATGEYIFVLAALFSASALAEAAGVEPIIGAFLAGLALNRLVVEGSPLSNRLHFFGNAFFIPFFLLSVGMLVDLRVLAGDLQAWKVMIGMVATVVAAKWGAAKLVQRRFGYTPEEGWTMFGLSVPQAAATLAAALIGYRLELFDTAVLNGTIMMILITCTLGPWVVERYGRRVALQEQQKPYEPTEAPQRILIPISNPESVEPLLDLAFLIRSPDSEEPLLPITVVPGDNRGAAARVARAEKVLSHAVVYAAGADVPVVPLTRVDRTPTGGIIRGMAESRATAVVAGWDGGSRRFGVFDGVLDQLMERTQQMLLVARIQQPLNTTSRLVVVLPPDAEHGHGFWEAVRAIKSLASRLGASIRMVVVLGDPDAYRRLFDSVRPAVPLEGVRLEGWAEIGRTLRDQVGGGDAVVLISARRGTVAWHRELQALPRELAGCTGANLMVIFPSDVAPAQRERRGRTVLPRSLTPERVVFDLPRMPHPQAVETLLRTELQDDPERLGELREAVLGGDRQFFTELRPGVGVVHARIDGLADTQLFLGISEEGILFPEQDAPTRLIFLLLTPADRPYEHLENLAAIVQALGRGHRVEELCRVRSSEDLFDWFRADPGQAAAAPVPAGAA